MTKKNKCRHRNDESQTPEQPTNFRCGTPDVDPDRTHLADIRLRAFSVALFQSQQEGKPAYSVELRGCQEYYMIGRPHYASTSAKLEGMANHVEEVRAEWRSDRDLLRWHPEELAHYPQFRTAQHLNDFVIICRTTAGLITHLELGHSLESFIAALSSEPRNTPEITRPAHEQEEDHEISR
jgi:hypothetical protein